MFTTDRLIIRKFESADLMDFFEYSRQKDLFKYDNDFPDTLENCRNAVEYFSKTDGYWAVCLKEANKVIGHIVCGPTEPKEFLTWSIGFGFNPDYHNKGYAFESCKCIMRHVFEDCGARRIISACHPDNSASWKLMEKLSMRREAHHIENCFFKRDINSEPIWWDSLEYAILKDEWAVINT